MHYTRNRVHGGPDKIFNDRNLSLEERFLKRVKKMPNDGCWKWLTGTDGQGYGRFAISHTKTVVSARWAYEHWVGPIPEGLYLDHLCHTYSDCAGGSTCPHHICVNPSHLEPVTPQENMLRGRTFAASNAAKTHCVRGHKFTEDSFIVDRGRVARQCKLCRVIRQTEYMQRKKLK